MSEVEALKFLFQVKDLYATELLVCMQVMNEVILLLKVKVNADSG